MIGAAVVGLGVGEAHARAYAADPRTELRWLYDLDAQRASALAAELGSRAAASLDEILGDPGIAVVSIASFDDVHYEQALAALQAGKSVFAEKPLCRSPGEARALKQAWESAGRPALGSNLVLRAAPLYEQLRADVASGSYGTPYAFDGDYLYGRLHKITDEWRADVDDYSVMLGGGVHLVDLMLWLTGQRPVRVTAAGNRISTEGTRFRYDDFVAATFEFESGLVGRITANFGAVQAHRHVVRLFGTEATFVADDAGARVHTSRDPAVPPRVLGAAGEPETKGALVPGFIASIGKPDAAAVQHELDVVCVCAAADRALAEGAAVDVDYA